MSLEFAFDESGIVLAAPDARPGLLGRLRGKDKSRAIDELSREDQALAFALADLQAVGEAYPGEVEVGAAVVRMSHIVAAALDRQTAGHLGLPPDVDLIFQTDVEGSIGATSFRPRYSWIKNGQRQMPQRTGSILRTSGGLRRLPLWLLEAVQVVDAFQAGSDDGAHWEALARFRRALEPPESSGHDQEAGAGPRVSMTEFLQGLRVRLSDSVAISPNEDATDFEVVPFSAERLESSGLHADEGDVGEDAAELGDQELRQFQNRVRSKGALPAYRVGTGSYLVMDKGVLPVLDVMARKQRSSPEERAAFIRNPRAAVTEAVEAHLRKTGQLDGLDPKGEEEAIEVAAGSRLIETREFSERVKGIREFEKAPVDWSEEGTTTWLPEIFGESGLKLVRRLEHDRLVELRDQISNAVESGGSLVTFEGTAIPANPQTLGAINSRLAEMELLSEYRPDSVKPTVRSKGAPLILDDQDNFDALTFQRVIKARSRPPGLERPAAVRTPLKSHQEECLRWQIASWEAGLPGVLNADEQGLGKTLQTIAFLSWLQECMDKGDTGLKGPSLVVAPTSLLENWEMEVKLHLDANGLGQLIPLYGSEVGRRRLGGMKGVDTGIGEATLDFAFLHEAIREGRAHRFWILTTYTTLTNYQHSLGRIPFAALVFDEIQNLKNPDSLRSHAARAMNADFRIGLTGTPIENSTTDLWAIIDQLVPGYLGSLRSFREQFRVAGTDSMVRLHDWVFRGGQGRPPVALRRLKEEVAEDLPVKVRRLHPRLMPPVQATEYEKAREKLAQGGPGASLKMLHHIRSVSVHPSIDGMRDDEDFIAASGRLSAALDILDDIASREERVLVFIEHIKMQYRFIELAKSRFGLANVELINGSTPIEKRQAIVNRFQDKAKSGPGFDLLVLGPKAAGVGLTLTAATHVVHLSRWWNPAVEEQCNDRVHRIGQTKPVTVHVPMAVHPGYREHSFDCLLHSLMQRKRRLASSALWPMGDTAQDIEELQRGMTAELTRTSGDPLRSAISAMFSRDGALLPTFEPDGSIRYP